MRHYPAKDDSAAAALAGLTVRYDGERARVVAAHRRMRDLVGAVHAPADARAAAVELTAALRDATSTAARAVRLADPGPTSRGRLRHCRKAVGVFPAAARPWTAELVRLADLDGWLRRTTLDELGVHVPAAVRVGSRAASGPHIAGLVAEPDDLVAATLHEPRIGVDLWAVIDELDHHLGGSAHTAPLAGPAAAALRYAAPAPDATLAA